MSGPDAGVVGVPVVRRLGVRIAAAGRSGADPGVLTGPALRHNPRRAHLLVSRVLGKHVPADPRLVRATGLLLGGMVADVLAGRPAARVPADLLHAAVRGEPGAAARLHADACAAARPPGPDALVLGFAETATGLGHCVAEALDADYLHSTRRPAAGAPTAAFAEEHSHAVRHLLLPRDASRLDRDRPLVLVDDELSTGRTVRNTIAALHARTPRGHYVLATLVDARPDRAGPDDRAEPEDTVRELGARVDVVSLARAVVTVPADVIARAGRIRREAGRGHDGPEPVRTAVEPDRVLRLDRLGWPAGVPDGGRHGFGPDAHRALDDALPSLCAALAAAAPLAPGDGTLVLGTEELMAVPLRLAQCLADAGHDVAFAGTTRSPALVVDEPGYALRDGITFAAHDDPADGPGPRFAYNLRRPGADPRWDTVLLVVDPRADTPALRTGLLPALAGHARRTVLVRTP